MVEADATVDTVPVYPCVAPEMVNVPAAGVVTPIAPGEAQLMSELENKEDGLLFAAATICADVAAVSTDAPLP